MAKCENCGKRNPFHTCYIGGSATSIDFTQREKDLVHRTVELNIARGDDKFKGLNATQRSVYKSQRG